MEYFIRLISEILSSGKWEKVLLVGAPNESAYVAKICREMPEDVRAKTIDMSGCLDMESFIALLRLSTLFITNDSGPLHIASALGTPTISFFGPETPTLYGPLGKKDMVFFAGLYCSPCLNVYNAKRAMCGGDNHCMKEITPAEVVRSMNAAGLL